MWETIGWDKLIQTALDKAADVLWRKVIEALAKRHKILLLGASGAGKTQFCDSIFDPSAVARATNDRTNAAIDRKGKAARKSLLLTDTPGEKEKHQAKRGRALRKAIQGRLDGIINVTCFGYHERDEADKLRAVPAKGPKVATAKYLAINRSEELSMLGEWVPLVDSHACPWFLTVVTTRWANEVNSEVN